MKWAADDPSETPKLTMNFYARTRDKRLSDLVEKIGKTVLTDS